MLLACTLTALGSRGLLAQVSPEEHARHHPQQAATTQPGAGQGMMEGMGEMMRGMGAPPRKELYPSLMELPELSPEKRDELQRTAHEQMKSGADLMAQGLDRLVQTAPTTDFAMMQTALVQVREGLAQFDSGLAAHRALAEGRSRQRVALDWFKSQMNLTAPPSHMERAGPLGLSWSHLFVMTLLIAFALVMIAMYFFKMRRASELLQRLIGPAAPVPAVALARSSSITAAPPPTSKVVAKQPAPAPGGTAAAQLEPAATAWGGSLRVANVFAETPSVKTFRLVNPAGGSIPFTFLPGQFLTLAVALAGKTVKRSYTMASSAAQRDNVEITVKREDKGVVSRYLHDRVAAGDLLQISAPSGYFTFTGAEADSVVLVGGGVGITPLMSIVRALTDRGWNKDIYLLYACRTTQDFVFREELERLQRRHANLHVVATMTRAEGTVWMGAKGRLTRELIVESVPDIAKRRVHLCGPPPMMDAMRAILLEAGVPGDQIKTEAFGPAERKEIRQPAVQAKMVEAAPETTATVTFTISAKAAPLPLETTVLEAAEHVGVSIDNSCRAGTCGTCKVKLLKGSVTMAIEDALTPEEKTRGIILACQAKSNRNIEVEA
ncbi:MAG: 2Fe-2S iron-sulfur cluster binding domain-containing protein [Phycisphaerales bacterium]|nr:2Fe-2S iron-sulfur cluster binding domain-containing protein [Phycisphaerales bacterium]